MIKLKSKNKFFKNIEDLNPIDVLQGNESRIADNKTDMFIILIKLYEFMRDHESLLTRVNVDNCIKYINDYLPFDYAYCFLNNILGIWSITQKILTCSTWLDISRKIKLHEELGLELSKLYQTKIDDKLMSEILCEKLLS